MMKTILIGISVSAMLAVSAPAAMARGFHGGGGGHFGGGHHGGGHHGGGHFPGSHGHMGGHGPHGHFAWGHNRFRHGYWGGYIPYVDGGDYYDYDDDDA